MHGMQLFKHGEAQAHSLQTIERGFIVCNSWRISIMICVDFSNIIWGDSHQLVTFSWALTPRSRNHTLEGPLAPIGWGAVLFLSMCGHSVGLPLHFLLLQQQHINPEIKRPPGAVVLTPPTTT